MTIRPILTVPDPVLKQVSKPVAEVTDETRALMDDMLETMYAAPGIGLAAVQIGVPLRVIVIDLAKEGEPPEPRYFVNPEIIETAGEKQAYEEGCLSVPDVFDEVEVGFAAAFKRVVEPDVVRVELGDCCGAGRLDVGRVDVGSCKRLAVGDAD